jgi:hypothetical protein
MSKLTKSKRRGHPDLNQGPLDLQSNALPLSYIPVDTKRRKSLHIKFPCRSLESIDSVIWQPIEKPAAPRNEDGRAKANKTMIKEWKNLDQSESIEQAVFAFSASSPFLQTSCDHFHLDGNISGCGPDRSRFCPCPGMRFLSTG